MSYWRVPLEVLEDPGELATWALAAIRAAGNAAQKPKRKAKKKQKKKKKGPAKTKRRSKAPARTRRAR
jgi:TfoX/Sxy family transcriptional regulator of competence genes